MNFGVQYLGSPSHSNLKFLLESGEELLANSMIISYNSPVIEDLTTNLFQSTIEVQDFSKDAVQCFLEASYSGDVKKISRSNFREVNKMGHVFDVAWIVDRCYKYFKSLTETVNVNNYTEQVFVFEEAMSMFTKLKKRNFVELVVKKFTSLTTCTEQFVPKYLSEISSCSTTTLDVIIEMTGKEEYILIQVLVNHLENNNCVIDPNTRYILENVTFSSCEAAHKPLYLELIEKLESIDSPSKEDFKLIVGLLKRFYSASSQSQELEVVKKAGSAPYLFHNFQQLQDIDDLETLATFLEESPLVTSSYSFYDAVFCWLFYKFDVHSNDPFVTITNQFVTKFSDIMKSRGWDPLPREYICIDTDYKNYSPVFGDFTAKILKNGHMVTEDKSSYNRIVSASEYTPDALFSRNHDIKFQYKQSEFACYREGHCGFILRVTAASGELDDSFNIQLVTDPDLYLDDLHFHEETSSVIGDFHLALDIKSSGNYHKDTPITWYGKPCKDATSRYWCWGANMLFAFSEGGHPPSDYFNYIRYRFLGFADKEILPPRGHLTYNSHLRSGAPPEISVVVYFGSESST